MLIKQIVLNNFRNFDKKAYNFNPFLTIIIGENARGKTNLLEGIFFIMNGYGFRESREEELIMFNSDQALVEGKFTLGDDLSDLRIILRKINNFVEKVFIINKTKKKFFQYQKELVKTILFSPEQIEIMTGPPENRRDYINRIISYYDLNYKTKFTNFENALTKRNKILHIYRDEDKLHEELEFWNKYLEEQADYIVMKRREYVDFLNKNNRIDNKKFRIKYLENPLNQTRLAEFFDQERVFKRTLIGPQKDDFQIYSINGPSSADWRSGQNLHHYGSRSEQRMAIFWLKINEIKFYEYTFNKKPILLLDDIFSELDHKNKKLIINLIEKYQTIITTTEIELLELAEIPKSIITL